MQALLRGNEQGHEPVGFTMYASTARSAADNVTWRAQYSYTGTRDLKKFKRIIAELFVLCQANCTATRFKTVRYDERRNKLEFGLQCGEENDAASIHCGLTFFLL
jgi:hypothetical protein